MRNKLIFLISFVVSIFSCLLMTVVGDESFIGFSFRVNIGQVLFFAISLSSMSFALSQRKDCLIYENNLANLVRIGSRKKALKSEIFKILLIVFIFEFAETVVIYFVNLLCYHRNSVPDIFAFFLLNYLIKSFFMLLQFFLEIKWIKGYSTIVVLAVFLILIFLGTALNSIYNNSNNPSLKSFIFHMNQLNLINYISIERTAKLVNNIVYPVSASILLILKQIFALNKVIEKSDILNKE